MLPGFETQTEDLSDYEKYTLVPVFITGFRNKYGKQNAVTNKSIVTRLKVKYKISDVRVRKIINYIRNHGLIPGLVASSEGYYISHDVSELKRYVQSLQGRENEIRRVKEVTIKFLKQIEKQSQGYFSFTENDR